MENVEKPRGGRPPTRPEDRRDTLLRVLTTKAERAELNQAAQAAGLDVSTWVRSIALERARQGAASTAAPKRSRKK